MENLNSVLYTDDLVGWSAGGETHITGVAIDDNRFILSDTQILEFGQ